MEKLSRRSKSDLPVTITVSKDSLSDSIKVFKLEGGADGATGSPGSTEVQQVQKVQMEQMVRQVQTVQTVFQH